MQRIVQTFLLCILVVSCSTKEISHKVLMYIGTSNNNPAKGIEVCYFDTVIGELSEIKKVASILNPNYQEIDVNNKLLFSVGHQNINNKWLTPSLFVYSINPESGNIKQLSVDSTYGKDPCYVSYDALSNNVYVANYSSGNVSNYSFNAGKLNYKNTIQHYGNGPDSSRQKGPHAHSINYDLDKQYIYSADLGADKIMVYKNGKLGMELIDSIVCHPGAGPRHFDFSPDKNLMGVLNELDCSVSFFKKDSSGIYKEKLKTLTMLPDTFKGFSKAADIHFSPDSKFLYASNRGFNSIAIYQILNSDIELISLQTDGINWPRNFTIDPSGKFILVANRDSDNITVYNRDVKTGLLIKLNHVIEVEKPVCLKFFYE